MKKRILPFFLAAALLAAALPVPAGAVDTSATAAILVDADTGEIFYQKNPDKQMLIASTTKIMTALVTLWYGGSLNETVTVSRRAASTEGSSMYLKAGETLTLETLLYGLLMRSGNDAAVAIAEHVGKGSEARFVYYMNLTAKELGMDHSSFANPHGLNQTGHYSTARDMAKLAAAAMQNPTLRRITSTKSITIGGRTMENHNKLLGMVEGCIGLKTGYTKAAGRTLVTCVERDGHRLIAVTLQDGNDWVDHQKLYEYGFSLLSQRDAAEPEPEPEPALPPVPSLRVATAGEYAGEAAVEGGRWAYASLIAAEDLYYPMRENDLLAVRYELSGPLTAPVTAGSPAGYAVYQVNGAEIGRVPLVCSEAVPLADVPALASLKSGLPA